MSGTDSYGSVSEAKRSRAAVSTGFLAEHIPVPANHRIRNQVSGKRLRRCGFRLRSFCEFLDFVRTKIRLACLFPFSDTLVRLLAVGIKYSSTGSYVYLAIVFCDRYATFTLGARIHALRRSCAGRGVTLQLYVCTHNASAYAVPVSLTAPYCARFCTQTCLLIPCADRPTAHRQT